MQCPYCLKFSTRKPDYEIVGKDRTPDPDFDNRDPESANTDKTYSYVLMRANCAACGRFILWLAWGPIGTKTDYREREYPNPVIGQKLLHPPSARRKRFQDSVPIQYLADYEEAVAVLPYSAKASAALSRRCLQNLIHDEAKIDKGDLAKEIQALLEARTLPSYIAQPLDAIRAVGNFGTHPLKSTQTGLILDVEPGEAELCLELIEGLFDFYFIQPARVSNHIMAINQKRKEAGKPPIQTP